MSETDSALGYHDDRGRTGVLLCHGFTGSPASMVPWASYLAEKGHSVRVPLLPGHGTTWQQMNRTRWQDWYAEVDGALDDLLTGCDEVVVAGLSMGGCLALRLAQQRPDDVRALMLVNPAVASADRRLLLVPVVRFVLGSIAGIGNDIKKPGVGEDGYDRTPLHALHSMRQMWREVRQNLSRIDVPLLLFRSAEDHVVDPSSSDAVVDGVSSADIQQVILHNSYHVATLDYDADELFRISAEFVAEHTGARDER